MKNGFLGLSEDERKLALDDAALRMRMEPVILEKDFWVSWLLGLLFAQPGLAPYLVFKGGTSLLMQRLTEAEKAINSWHHERAVVQLQLPTSASS